VILHVTAKKQFKKKVWRANSVNGGFSWVDQDKDNLMLIRNNSYETDCKKTSINGKFS